MEHWWNYINKGKQKYVEKNLSHCHIVHHEPHMDCWGIEFGPPS